MKPNMLKLLRKRIAEIGANAKASDADCQLAISAMQKRKRVAINYNGFAFSMAQSALTKITEWEEVK